MKNLRRILAACALLSVGGAACSSDFLGQAGCANDDQCPEGHRCVDKICLLECDIDFDCEDGNPCTTNVCNPTRGCVDSFNTGPCEDGNSCTDGDVCYAGECLTGAALPDGTLCEPDGPASGRDICVDVACVPAFCGDDYVDTGALPPEECDDGNSVNGDGCEMDCTIVPPELTLTAPERGATLTGSTEILVEGTAADPGLGLASVTINGDAVSVNADGTFFYPMAAEHGLNFVEAIATNMAGKTTRRTVGYYWSAAYLDVADSPTDTTKLGAGLVMRIAQEVIDDGDHPCTYGAGTYSCTEIDDIATLGEVVLNNLDLSAGLGTIPIYQNVTPFLTQYYDFGPATIDVGGLPLVFAGEIGLLGDVTLTVEVTDLDFNQLALAMQSRTGGIDADIRIDEMGATPGFVMSVRTTAQVAIEAKFTTVSATLDGFPIDLIACIFLGASFDVICPDSNGDYAPLASVYPAAFVDSGLTIQRMTLETGFDIYTLPGGGIQVDLAYGNVDFSNSQLDLNPIQSMQIDLGTLDILGIQFPLPTVSLNSIASGLNGILNAASAVILNGLQPILEAAINVLLLNPNDPLALGSIIQTVIEQLAPSGTLQLTAFAGQNAAPVVTIESELDAITLTAPIGGDLLTGGMTPSAAMLFVADKQVNRTPLGTVLADGCYGTTSPPLVFAEATPLEMANHIDAINQALYAVWWNGGFNFPIALSDLITPPAALPDFTFDLDPYTAPILNNCNGYRLVLQVADLRASGSFVSTDGRMSFEAFSSLEIPVDVTVNAGVISLVVATGEPSFFATEIVSVPGEDVAWIPELEPLLERILRDEILVGYGSSIVAALPAFEIDLSTISGDPSGSILTFQPTGGAEQNGYTVLTGTAGQ